MGKASRWFRNILGFKKLEQKPTSNPGLDPDQKRRWTFVKSSLEKNANTQLVTKHRESEGSRQHHELKTEPEEEDDDDDEKHAIAVAAATAAVAEAAVAAAQAAAAVVRLTNSNSRWARNLPAHFSSSSRSNNSSGCEIQILAAIRIQSTFRGYLARRALRALKGLVKLQAIIRGHIERKRTAEWLRRMQALLRVQTRARVGRALVSESSKSTNKSYHSHHHGPLTPEKIEHTIRSKSMKYERSPMLKKNGSVSNGKLVYDFEKGNPSWNPSEGDKQSTNQRVSSVRISTICDENNDKILEVDTGKHHSLQKRRNLFHSDPNSFSFATSKDSTTHQTVGCSYSGEVQSFISPQLDEKNHFCFADDYCSPELYSGSSSRVGNDKRSPVTPTMSDGSRSYVSGYSDHPSYMSYTESSKAKLRSFSAPKQRPLYERSGSGRRSIVHGFNESKSQKVLTMNVNYSKAYPGSGRLDRLGLPIGARY